MVQICIVLLISTVRSDYHSSGDDITGNDFKNELGVQIPVVFTDQADDPDDSKINRDFKVKMFYIKIDQTDELYKKIKLVQSPSNDQGGKLESDDHEGSTEEDEDDHEEEHSHEDTHSLHDGEGHESMSVWWWTILLNGALLVIVLFLYVLKNKVRLSYRCLVIKRF